MSLDYMTLAWRTELPAGARLVMLALCDNANDEGNCRPSVQTLANKCGMSVRAVRGHVAAMECSSLLQRHERSGRSTCYQINLKALRAAVYKCLSARKELSEYDRGIWRSCASDDLSNGTPADSAPRQITPATPADSADPPYRFLPTPPAESAARTIKEPLKEPVEKKEKKTTAQAPSLLTIPDWINPQHWATWHSCDKRKKCNDAQKQLAIDKLAKWRDAGIDHAGALENAAIGGWQGLFEPKSAQPTTAYQDRQAGRANFFATMTTQGRKNANLHTFDDSNTIEGESQFIGAYPDGEADPMGCPGF